jgi:hypothetical protein
MDARAGARHSFVAEEQHYTLIAHLKACIVTITARITTLTCLYNEVSVSVYEVQRQALLEKEYDSQDESTCFVNMLSDRRIIGSKSTRILPR